MRLANFRDESGWHCESADGYDVTLCGDTWDGESIITDGRDPEYKRGLRRDITCIKCLNIISFCRGLK